MSASPHIERLLSGQTGLSDADVAAYRELFAAKGYSLPPWEPSATVTPISAARRRRIRRAVRQTDNGQQSQSSSCCGGVRRQRRAIHKVMTAAKAFSHWLADGGRTTSYATRQGRLSLCERCPLFRESSRQCEECGCFLDAKVRLRREICPAGKWLQNTDGHRALVEPTRHLMFHVWPVAGNGWWQWNIGQLVQRIEQFNGVRSVAVVTQEPGGRVTDSLDAVKRAFGDHRIDHWIVKENNQSKREGGTHRELIDTLPRGPSDITFSAHAKGAKAGPIETYRGAIQPWAQIMYSVGLDDIAAVERALADFRFAGSLRRFNRMSRNGWHYSGTFYWFRNERELLERGLVARAWWATESWPGDVAEHFEAACLLGDGVGNLYQWSDLGPIVDEYNNVWAAARDLPPLPWRDPDAT